MKNPLIKLLALAILVVFSGCASSYRAIRPQNLYYSNGSSQDGIDVAYRYDVLRERGNRKYAKKEDRKYVKVIALKITNHTDSIINLGRNASLYLGTKKVYPMEPTEIKRYVRQSVPAYLPYLLFTFFNITITEDNDVKNYPVGYALGPGLAIGNMAMAGTANKKFLGELIEYNLIGRNIQPGETVYGLVGLQNLDYGPISLQLTE